MLDVVVTSILVGNLWIQLMVSLFICYFYTFPYTSASAYLNCNSVHTLFYKGICLLFNNYCFFGDSTFNNVDDLKVLDSYIYS